MNASGVLVLNSSYEPLGIASITRAVRLIFAGKAEVVHENGRITSPTISIPLPSIIRMLYYIRRGRKRVPLTKRNVLLRDDFRCAYCEKRGERLSMTVDHIVPRSRGGSSTWENLVASCSPCNSRKKDRLPAEAGMPLRIKPREPQHIPFITIQRHTTPNEWAKYLFWDIGIEERIR